MQRCRLLFIALEELRELRSKIPRESETVVMEEACLGNAQIVVEARARVVRRCSGQNERSGQDEETDDGGELVRPCHTGEEAASRSQANRARLTLSNGSEKESAKRERSPSPSGCASGCPRLRAVPLPSACRRGGRVLRNVDCGEGLWSSDRDHGYSARCTTTHFGWQCNEPRTGAKAK